MRFTPPDDGRNSGALPDADDTGSLGLPPGWGKIGTEPRYRWRSSRHRRNEVDRTRGRRTDVGIDRDNLRGGQARRDPAHAGEQFHPNPGGCRGLTANVSTDNPSHNSVGSRETTRTTSRQPRDAAHPAWATVWRALTAPGRTSRTGSASARGYSGGGEHEWRSCPESSHRYSRC